MSTYYVDMSAAFTIQQTSAEVNHEETKFFSWFRDSVVATDRNLVVVNRTEFEEDNNRPMPSTTKLIVAGTSPPAGLAKFWTGSMVVQGTIRTVEAYR